MLRESFLGIVKIHILYHAPEPPIYGQQVIEEDARHGYNLRPGMPYPTLRRPHGQGHLPCKLGWSAGGDASTIRSRIRDW